MTIDELNAKLEKLQAVFEKTGHSDAVIGVASAIACIVENRAALEAGIQKPLRFRLRREALGTIPFYAHLVDEKGNEAVDSYGNCLLMFQGSSVERMREHMVKLNAIGIRAEFVKEENNDGG